MTSIAIGALGAPTLAHALEDAFGGALSHDVVVAISVALAYAIVTSVQLIFGEMVPKFYAIDRSESVARRIARPLQGFSALFGPIIRAITVISARLLKALGVDMGREPGGGSPDELKRLIAESHAGGQLDPGEAGMLRGVFHLHEQEARQVMTPSPAVISVDVSKSVETALKLCIASGHTRLVVTEGEDRDRVRGLVHASALARTLMDEGLDDLLADLQRQRSSLAVVIDEYGRVAGIVTVEDIIEEVVGEITDETDPAAGEIRRLPDGDWFVRGHVAVSDLVDYGVHLPADTDAYNSVGGFVFAELGRLPRRGDAVTAGPYSIRVESVRENRVEAVRIRERRAVPAREAKPSEASG
jgi:CBS domain containing-hemolysin-like protein